MALEQSAKGLELFHHQSLQIFTLENLVWHADAIGIGQNHPIGSCIARNLSQKLLSRHIRACPFGHGLQVFSNDISVFARVGQGDLFLDKRGFVLHKRRVQGILVFAMGANIVTICIEICCF